MVSERLLRLSFDVLSQNLGGNFQKLKKDFTVADKNLTSAEQIDQGFFAQGNPKHTADSWEFRVASARLGPHRRSRIINAVNALSRLVPGGGSFFLRLDGETLLRKACKRTGLEDYGDLPFLEPLKILLHSLEFDAQLHFVGRICAYNDILRLLCNRLQLVEDRKRHPEIADEVIRRPLFITGLPRTGTTFLHGLMNQDPLSRAPQVWEVMHPSPPPERATYDHDPRIDVTAKELRWIKLLMPDFETAHMIGPRLPQECIAVTGPSFRSYEFDSMYYVPGYRAWLDREDKGPGYEYHRLFLQHLQWRCPGTHWVLKAPSHLLALDALFRVYPDAGIVMTHRDPLKVLPSCASFTEVLRGGFTDQLDRKKLGREVKDRWEGGAALAIKFREENPVLRGRFFDVHYSELVREPISVVRRIYEHFGMRLTGEAEKAMERFLAENPMNKKGVHRYSLAEFDFDPSVERHRFQFYTDYFRIKAEM